MVIVASDTNAFSYLLTLLLYNLPFEQILPALILLSPWTAFTITGLDRTYHPTQPLKARL